MPAHTPDLLTDTQISEKLAQLPGWTMTDNHLCRRYKTAGWKASLMVVNAIGHLAEAAWHHPDLHLSYNQVNVALQTHSSGGITMMDFELAHKMEAFIGWQPGTEPGALTGTPDEPRHRYVVYDSD